MSPSDSRMADRKEVQGSVEICGGGDLEVGRLDRGDEAVIERLREPERRVDPAPPRAHTVLVEAQPAGVDDAEELDPCEARPEQPAVPRRRVLAELPGGVRLL